MIKQGRGAVRYVFQEDHKANVALRRPWKREVERGNCSLENYVYLLGGKTEI